MGKYISYDIEYEYYGKKFHVTENTVGQSESHMYEKLVNRLESICFAGGVITDIRRGFCMEVGDNVKND